MVPTCLNISYIQEKNHFKIIFFAKNAINFELCTNPEVKC